MRVNQWTNKRKLHEQTSPSSKRYLNFWYEFIPFYILIFDILLHTMQYQNERILVFKEKWISLHEKIGKKFSSENVAFQTGKWFTKEAQKYNFFEYHPFSSIYSYRTK